MDWNDLTVTLKSESHASEDCISRIVHGIRKLTNFHWTITTKKLQLYNFVELPLSRKFDKSKVRKSR